MKLTINGEVLSQDEVEREYQRLLKALGAHLSPEELARRTREIQRQALDHAIGRLLLLLEARRLEIAVAREEIDRAVDNLTRACGGESGFQAHLKKLNLSLDALRRQIQEARQTEKLIEQITAACPKPSEDEVTSYFQDHFHEFIKQDAPPDTLPPPETIRAHVRQALFIAAKNQHLTAFIARLKKDAVIKEAEGDSHITE